MDSEFELLLGEYSLEVQNQLLADAKLEVFECILEEMPSLDAYIKSEIADSRMEGYTSTTIAGRSIDYGTYYRIIIWLGSHIMNSFDVAVEKLQDSEDSPTYNGSGHVAIQGTLSRREWFLHLSAATRVIRDDSKKYYAPKVLDALKLTKSHLEDFRGLGEPPQDVSCSV